MTGLGRMSKDELLAMMDETEEHIREIRRELLRREQQEQHEAIDNLEFHLERAKVNWSDVKAFFQLVLRELRGSKR